MQLRIKKLNENAVIPKFAKQGDAGLDLIATEYSMDEFGNHVYKTGLVTEFPENYVGLLFPRSSVSKYGLVMANCVGVLDSGFRGEILVKFKKIEGQNTEIYKVGDKVAQLVFLEIPKIEIVEAENLNESERGMGGFGSTGS